MAARLGRVSPSPSLSGSVAAGSSWSLTQSEMADHRVLAAKHLRRAGIEVANTPLKPVASQQLLTPPSLSHQQQQPRSDASGADGRSPLGIVEAMEDIARRHAGLTPLKIDSFGSPAKQ
jgi:hypothetical protein